MSDLRIGIAGLGTASALVLPAMGIVPGVALAAAADIRPQARAAFAASHGLPVFDDVGALCRSGLIDAVWIETPNHLHCEHAVTAARAGLHVICAKPLGVTLAECESMIDAAARAGVKLLQGHSKVFDSPVAAMRAVIASGELGRVLAVQTLMHNDWLRRPRLPEELDAARGGGLILRQAPHQVDIARYLVGGRAIEVRAIASAAPGAPASAGHYAALVAFEDGASATLMLNGLGFFDSSELHWNIGVFGARRPAMQAPLPPIGALEAKEKYAAAGRRSPALAVGPHMPFFGLTIVSCERGTIRQSPDGLFVHTERGREEVRVPPNQGRAAELIELRDAVAHGRPAFPGGQWGLATLEICLAMQESARDGHAVVLAHQGASQ